MKNTFIFVIGFCSIPLIFLGFIYVFIKASFDAGQSYAKDFVRWLR